MLLHVALAMAAVAGAFVQFVPAAEAAPAAASFAPATNVGLDGDVTPVSVAVGDLNGDTRPDLVTANQDSANVSVLLNSTPPADTTAPTFTIDQAPSQADPTSDSPITFDVVFSEPVTGFESTDVDLSASTAGARSARW